MQQCTCFIVVLCVTFCSFIRIYIWRLHSVYRDSQPLPRSYHAEQVMIDDEHCLLAGTDTGSVPSYLLRRRHPVCISPVSATADDICPVTEVNEPRTRLTSQNNAFRDVMKP